MSNFLPVKQKWSGDGVIFGMCSTTSATKISFFAHSERSPIVNMVVSGIRGDDIYRLRHCDLIEMKKAVGKALAHFEGQIAR